MEKQKRKREEYELRQIGVLDGVRVVAILLVVWYHFWQQSWIIPVAGPVNLDWLVRNGAIAVDMMILLSAFCLFLPYARNMMYGGEYPSTGDFYWRRIARIVPSYYVILFIVLFLFAIPMNEYAGVSEMLQDLIPHLVFLHNWFPASSVFTHLNGAMWTVGVIVQFYVVFPLLAKAFQRKPLVTYGAMTLVGLVSSFLISSNFDNLNQMLYVNNTLTFFSVYANGMLGAWLYISWTREHKRTRQEGIFFTLIALTCLWIFKILCEHRTYSGSEAKWQLDYRYLLSLVFLILIISIILSARWFRVLWDNKVMHFLAGISFNLYLCHQYIAVKLKEFHIPFWEGDTPPNQLGDEVWQWKYLLLCIVISFAVAVAMTYLVEKPVAKWIRKIVQEKN